MFWRCPNLSTYWRNIHKMLNLTFGTEIPWFCYPGTGNWQETSTNPLSGEQENKKTRKCFNPTHSTVEGWLDIALEIFEMEKLIHTLNIQRDQFNRIWNKWIKHRTPTTDRFLQILCHVSTGECNTVLYFFSHLLLLFTFSPSKRPWFRYTVYSF